MEKISQYPHGRGTNFPCTKEDTAVEKLLSLFAKKIKFFYWSWDRIVINGYLTTLFRPEQLVRFFRDIAGKNCITKDVLKERTNIYNAWVASYAANRGIPVIGVQEVKRIERKEDFVLPFYRRLQGDEGVACILKSMEQNRSFCSYEPRYKTRDPDYRIIKPCRSRFMHYYFYILDPVMGPMSMRVATYLPFNLTFYLNGHSYLARQMDLSAVKYRKYDNTFLALENPAITEKLNQRLTPALIHSRLDYWALRLAPSFSKKERYLTPIRYDYSMSQIEYALDIVFKRHTYVKEMFDRGCELGLLLTSADRISKMFGTRITKRSKGKFHTVLDKRDLATPVLRHHFKNTFLRNYLKGYNLNSMRFECCTNNVYDLRAKRRLENLPSLQHTMQGVVNNFLDFQADLLNNSPDTGAFADLAKPVFIGTRRIPGLKLQDKRLIRLLDVLLHDGASLSTWTTSVLRTMVLKKYHLTEQQYTLNQLRYDLSKLRAHGLVEKIPDRRRYRLNATGVKLGILFVQFHQRFAGPLTSISLGKGPVSANHVPDSKVEKQIRKISHELDQLATLVSAA